MPELDSGDRSTSSARARDVEVSVVIPTRDRWHLLATTVASVLAQDGVDLEIIIVDDGSTERASSRSFLDDPRIQVLRHQRSRGVASARNAGIAEARGEWVAFLDDDDVWAPEKLARQLEAARSADAAFVYASVLLVRTDTATVLRADAPPPEELADRLRAYNAVPAGASNVVAKSEVVRAVGGFDRALFHLADWDLWMRLAAAGPAAACPAPLVGYRLHPASMRSTAGGVLRELRQLDAKHGRERGTPPDRIWLYRWLAEGQLLAGRPRAAALTYARGGLRCRSRSDLLKATRTLLNAEEGHRTSLGATSARAQATVKAPAWLRHYLSDVFAGDGDHRTGDVPSGGPRLGPKQRVRLIGAVALARALRFTARKSGVGLVYHELTATPRSREAEIVPTVDTESFRAQLGHLRSHYRLVSAGQLMQATLERKRGDPFPVAITFDDDLRSHVELALPLLRGASATATFFLTGASLHGPSSFWWERVQRALDEGVALEPSFARPEETVAALAALPASERSAYASLLLERIGGEREASGLRVEHVEALAGAGFEIGFHTRAHEPLVGLDQGALDRALHAGADDLAGAAGRPLATIAYPHGQADARVAAAARAAGYAAGYTTDGSAIRADTDPLLMGRLYPSRASLGHFAAQLALTVWRSSRRRDEGVSGTRREQPRGIARRAGSRLRARFGARSRIPAVGHVRFGNLRRLTPISRQYGINRGLPIDRHYIEDFLRRHAGSVGYGGGDIRGHVLEVGGDEYVRRFGSWSGEPGGDDSTSVTEVDVLHADASNPGATIVGDLASGAGIPDQRYDCVICTQTLQVVYDVAGAVRTLHRMLKPGGVALVTVAGISQACRPDRDLWGDYWRFTSLSARRLFEAAFDPDAIRVEAYGNVLASIAFLHGLAAEDLSRHELEPRDPDYELVICVRARKAGQQ